MQAAFQNIMLRQSAVALTKFGRTPHLQFRCIPGISTASELIRCSPTQPLPILYNRGDRAYYGHNSIWFSPFLFSWVFGAQLKMSDARYCVEYARTGRSGCKKCKQTIEKGVGRIGKITSNPFSDDGGEMKVWYHTRCMFETLKVRGITAIVEYLQTLVQFCQNMATFLFMRSYRIDFMFHK